MFSFLSMDSKFMQILSRFTDLVLLNLVYLMTCLPVFTIGAANAALYRVCFQLFRQQEDRIFQDYFRAFRDNFKQGTVLWLLWLLVCLPGSFYVLQFLGMASPLRYLCGIFFFVILLAVFLGCWAFPWISQFRNDTITVLRNTLILSISHLPRTVCVMAIQLLPWAMMLFFPELFLKISFLWFALYFSAAAFVITAILWKVFRPFYPEEATQEHTTA